MNGDRGGYYLNRRDFLRYSLATSVAVWAGLAYPGGLGLGDAEAQDLFAVRRVNPATFPQGVASGDPRPNGVVLWTRIASQAAGNINVAYEISAEPRFRSPVLRGVVATDAGRDYTVKTQVSRSELRPFRTYFYRFIVNGEASRTGRFKTLPAESAEVERIRFGYVSCQDYTNGYYNAMSYLAEEDVDFIVHLGDYIYETTNAPEFQGGGPPERAIPELPSGEDQAETLEDYRFLYRKYRSDPELQRLHERFAFITIWDDHEFANDCHQVWDTDDRATEEDQKTAGTVNHDPERRSDANRAWAEFIPAGVPYDAENGDPLEEIRIYRSFVFGDLLELVMTDERLYRDAHPCGPNTEDKYLTPGDPGFEEEDLTMLGEEQKAWFLDRINGSSRLWKVWGNETMVMQFKTLNTEILEDPTGVVPQGIYVSLDQWDGFQVERREILQSVKDAGTQNFVIITGDIHSFIAGYAKLDFDSGATNPPDLANEDQSNLAGTCFVCGSITSSNLFELASGGAASRYSEVDPVNFTEAVAANNPHIEFFNSQTHGYNLIEVNRDELVCTMKSVDTIQTPRSASRTLAVFAVANQLENGGDIEIEDRSPAMTPGIGG